MNQQWNEKSNLQQFIHFANQKEDEDSDILNCFNYFTFFWKYYEANSNIVQFWVCQILNKFLENMTENTQIENILCIKLMKTCSLDWKIKFQMWEYM